MMLVIQLRRLPDEYTRFHQSWWTAFGLHSCRREVSFPYWEGDVPPDKQAHAAAVIAP